MQDLVKCMDMEDPDYENLSLALEQMKDVAEHVNHQMRLSTAIKDLYRIQRMIAADGELVRVLSVTW